MNCSQVLESLLFCEDKDYGVVPVAATGVHGDGGGLVDHDEVLRHPDHADPGVSHRHLVSENCGFLKNIVTVYNILCCTLSFSVLKVFARTAAA